MPALAPYTQLLTEETAAHLLRRATFGPSQIDIATFTGLTASQALDILLQPASVPSPPLHKTTGEPWLNPPPAPGIGDEERREEFFGWWLDTMYRQQLSLTERMVWFYHTHFPTIETRLNHTLALYYQIAFFRHYALGNYRDLTKAMCIDNAMLVHLDGALNESGAPQENFAREFFELFTVGKGEQVSPDDYTTFTEQDVQAATRVLTGWGTDFTFTTLDTATGFPTGKVKANGQGQANKHDSGTKQFSAAFGNTVIQPGTLQGSLVSIAGMYEELDAFIQMVFSSVHTARHIVRKLYRFFVYYKITPQIETDVIIPLAQQLMSAQYEISGVLKTLLSSNHFFDADDAITQNDVRGAIIKSPVEVTLGTLRTLEISMPTMTAGNLPSYYATWSNSIYNALDGQGLSFYEPYDVAGYDPYYQFPGYNRLWITPNNLAMRYKMSEGLMAGVSDMNGNLLFQFNAVTFVQQHIANPADPDAVVSGLVKLLIPVTLSQERYIFFRDNVLLDTLSAINWGIEWNQFVNGGPDTNVRVQLESLFRALIQCPEYQLI
jgi:uncharacterized protein (DUF1800 family)